MHAISHAISLTTDVSGDVTAYTPDDVNGRIFQVQYVKDDFDDGSTITLTGAKTGVPIFSITGMNASATHQILRTATASEETASGTGAVVNHSGAVRINDTDAFGDADVGDYLNCDFADDDHADGRYKIDEVFSDDGVLLDLAYVANNEAVDWVLNKTFPVHEPVALAGERIKCVVSSGGDTKNGALAIISG